VATGVLSGHFALVIVCDGPDRLARGVLESELRGRLETAGLDVSAWDVGEVGPAPAPSQVLTVYGPDRPGIVHGIASVLAELGVSICDMTCRFQGDLYLLTMELDVPAEMDQAELESAIAEASARLGLEHALNRVERADL